MKKEDEEKKKRIQSLRKILSVNDDDPDLFGEPFSPNAF